MPLQKLKTLLKPTTLLPAGRGQSGQFNRKLSGPLLMLSANPPIFHLMDWGMRDKVPAVRRLFRYLKKRRAYFLYTCSWFKERPEQVAWVKKGFQRHTRQFPLHRFIVLCATENQQKVFSESGIEAIYCNQNCFSDESIYHPLPEAEKIYNAVYDARMSPFKRHCLAGKVSQLALITNIHDGKIDPNYARETKACLKNAHWFNNPFTDEFYKLKPSEVNRAINQCKVGLCLSAEEGAMYGSIQYLLAGLPIVSTKSRGGRDVFFDDDYVRIVEDHPEAVAAGVVEMAKCRISPVEIRRRTLTKMQVHRHRLIELVNCIYREENVRRDFASEWPHVACNYFVDYSQTVPEIIARIGNA